jgi:hypothetical protein
MTASAHKGCWRVKQLPQPLARGNPKRNFLFSDTKAAKGPYQKTGVVKVAQGPDAHQKVVMEGVIEVGRYFILYEVKK